MEKYPSFTDHTCSIGMIEMLTQELSRINLDFNILELYLTSVGMQEEKDEEIEALAKYLNFQTPYKRDNFYKTLG